jgi:dihydrofolate reductase
MPPKSLMFPLTKCPTTSVEALATQIRRLDVGKVVIIGGDSLKAQALRDKLAADGMVVNMAAQ